MEITHKRFNRVDLLSIEGRMDAASAPQIKQQIDALFEQGPCFVWDWAATNLIVAEAGGLLTQLDGSAPEPGCHLLVTNGKLADEMQSAIYPAESGGR